MEEKINKPPGAGIYRVGPQPALPHGNCKWDVKKLHVHHKYS